MRGGELCAARILAALGGEDEGDFLVDWIEDRRVVGKTDNDEDVHEYLVHWAGYEEKTWTRDVSYLLVDD